MIQEKLSLSSVILWDLTSKNVRMLENSWSVSVRHMWVLPNNSHRFFIEPLEGIHVRSMLYSRYANFLQAAQKSSKLTFLILLQIVKNDLQTRTFAISWQTLSRKSFSRWKRVISKRRSSLLHSSLMTNGKYNLWRKLQMQNVLHLEGNENGQFQMMNPVKL